MLDSYYTFLNEFPESTHIKELERMARDARDFLDKNRKGDDSGERHTVTQ